MPCREKPQGAAQGIPVPRPQLPTNQESSEGQAVQTSPALAPGRWAGPGTLPELCVPFLKPQSSLACPRCRDPGRQAVTSRPCTSTHTCTSLLRLPTSGTHGLNPRAANSLELLGRRDPQNSEASDPQSAAGTCPRRPAQVQSDTPEARCVLSWAGLGPRRHPGLGTGYGPHRRGCPRTSPALIGKGRCPARPRRCHSARPGEVARPLSPARPRRWALGRPCAGNWVGREATGGRRLQRDRACQLQSV